VTQRDQAIDDAIRASSEQKMRDRGDELHAQARGAVLRWLTRKEYRRRMRDSLANPGPGRFYWRITDYEALPIERLKPYLDPRAIEAAIALAISMGLRDLGGVQIEQDFIGGSANDRPTATTTRRRSPAAATDHDRGHSSYHVAYDRRADHGRLARG
jgi:hypothetical protein